MPPPRPSTPSRSSRQRSTSPRRFRSISTGRLDQTSSAASAARGPRFGPAAVPGTLAMPLALACTAALYIAYRTLEARGFRPLLLNGLSLGLAASLKYNGAFAFAGIAAAQMMRARVERSGWQPLLGRLVLIAAVGIGTLVVT